MRYISFAQDFEDIILFSAFGKYIKKGIYVDIGANDPCMISVTKFFYDLGWRGMNVEPLDDKYGLLCAERAEDENINLGVSDKDGELELGIAGAGSSFRYTDISGQKVVKQVRKFADIYRQSRFFGQDVHFCKIDVEGFEKNVLNGIDFTQFRPWIFVIESVLPATNIPCHDEWEGILTANGYSCGLAHGANRYYVREDKGFLTDGLTGFGKLFWDNNILKAGYSDIQNRMKSRLDGAQQIALFGAGAYMHNFFEVYGGAVSPSIIVDNSREKQGEEIHGIKIQSPDILKDDANKNALVLICCAKTDEIKEQLKEMGVKNYMEYSLV